MSRPPAPRVVLIGPPGAGKSTVAELLARLLGVGARDTDTDIATAAGRPVADIFVTDGEQAFRAVEREAVLAALASHDGVLALGGGAVVDQATQESLHAYANAGGVVVFLDVSLAAAAPRVGFNQPRAVLLGNPRATWQALMAERRPVYEDLATAVITTDGRTPAEVAHAVRDLLEDR